MGLDALLFDELLGGNITGSKEHGGSDALGEKRPRGEAAIVPEMRKEG